MILRVRQLRGLDGKLYFNSVFHSSTRGDFIIKITKVIFTPKLRAPNNCKVAEYFVNTENWNEAIETAKTQFKLDNKLHRYYKDSIATTVNVL